MQERRNLKRRHLLYYLRVFDAATGVLLGKLVDISADGMMLISEQAIELDRCFQLEMDLPANEGITERISFTARSAWCREDINPDFYDTGFQIVKLDPGTSQLIERLIDHFGFRD